MSEIGNIYSVYYSATFSTKNVVNEIAGSFGAVHSRIDITGGRPQREVVLEPSDLLVVGVPVYGGRVPPQAVEGLNALKGDGTPALIICVYGNRDYDDALLELNDIVRANGCIPFAAAAVIAEHCIFPKVATGRPDASDWQKIKLFCQDAAAALKRFNPAEMCESPGIKIKGRRPYKKSAGTPLYPSAGNGCNMCGTCARQCPAGAISADNSKITDAGKCISCARCINVCPQHARGFGGVLYKVVGWIFVKGFSKRREPEFMLA